MVFSLPENILILVNPPPPSAWASYIYGLLSDRIKLIKYLRQKFIATEIYCCSVPKK